MAVSLETDKDGSCSYVWKNSHLTIKKLIEKRKIETFCSLQVWSAFSACVSCRQWRTGTEKAVAFCPVCVFCECVGVCVCLCVCNPLTPPRVQRQHPLGATKGTSNRLTFLTASDRAQSVELFIQVLWGKVAIFTGETNPQMNCGCLSLQVNTVVMIWGCDAFWAKWQPISPSAHMLKTHTSHCLSDQSEPLRLSAQAETFHM